MRGMFKVVSSLVCVRHDSILNFLNLIHPFLLGKVFYYVLFCILRGHFKHLSFLDIKLPKNYVISLRHNATSHRMIPKPT
jgi:hypothetical protein